MALCHRRTARRCGSLIPCQGASQSGKTLGRTTNLARSLNSISGRPGSGTASGWSRWPSWRTPSARRGPGREATKKAGLEPIKINAVIVRGHNEDEVADFAAFAREHDVKMRFIEFMPLDSGHDWSRADVFSGREIHERINARFPLTAVDVDRGSETSSRYRFTDGAPGEIGIIAPVTEPFCGACSRIRLTADGQIRTCLFSTVEHSLRDVVRSGATRTEIVEFIEAVVLKKEPRHYINDPGFVTPSRTMSFIGG